MDNPDIMAGIRHPPEQRPFLFDPYGLIEAPADPSLERITRLAARTFGAAHAALTIDLGSHFYVAAHVGLDQCFVERGVAICKHVINRGEALAIPDMSVDPRLASHEMVRNAPNLRFYGGVPIRSHRRDKPIGVLCVTDPKQRWLDQNEMAALTEFGEIMGDALALRDSVIRDALTGLYNRKFFDDQGLVELERCRRAGEGFAMLMIDVDHFKSFNDRYGYLAGDQALRTIGEIIFRCVQRPGDIACRYAGKEFTIFLPGANGAVAMPLIDEIHRQLRRAALLHEGSPTGLLTISAGLQAMAGPIDAATTFEAVVTAAEGALYASKENGRNQTTRWDF